MADKIQFKFNILTGPDAEQKYQAETKDPYTLYILKDVGKGYFGETLMFSGNDGITSQLTSKFFRAVAAHTVVTADMSDENFVKESDVKVGDYGIMFIADTDGENNGNETKYFIKLASVDIEQTEEINPENPTTAFPTEEAVVNYVESAISELPNPVNTINEEVPEGSYPTVTAVIAYVQKELENRVSYQIDGEDVDPEGAGGGNGDAGLNILLKGGKKGQAVGKLSDAEGDIGWVDVISEDRCKEIINEAFDDLLNGEY